MVVRLRLSRQGTKNNPFYHVVAIADHKPRDARPIEKLGEYDPIPRRNPILPNSLRNHSNNRSSPITSGLPTGFRLEKRLEWDQDRIKHWLKEGAQPSKPVARLLDRAGLIPKDVFYKGMFRPTAESTSNSTSTSSDSVEPATSPINERTVPSAEVLEASNSETSDAAKVGEGSLKTMDQAS